MQSVWEYSAIYCWYRLAGMSAINLGDPSGASHAGVHLCKSTRAGCSSRIYTTQQGRAVKSFHAVLAVISAKSSLSQHIVKDESIVHIMSG